MKNNGLLYVKYFMSILVFTIFTAISIQSLKSNSLLNSLHNEFMLSAMFRKQDFNDIIQNKSIVNCARDEMIEEFSVYLLGTGSFAFWRESKNWNSYYSAMESIWKDIQYFPIPLSSNDDKSNIYFEDSWGAERSYGGTRPHEGTDLFPTIDTAGYYPVLSMTDGIVTNIGWLEKGGYRIGITSPSDGYYYYAHLDSYGNLKKGDCVKAGELIGYMGNSGYGIEGTRGEFPVHLHVGIYIYVQGEEISVNPYCILKYLESYKLKYRY